MDRPAGSTVRQGSRRSLAVAILASALLASCGSKLSPSDLRAADALGATTPAASSSAETEATTGGSTPTPIGPLAAGDAPGGDASDAETSTAPDAAVPAGGNGGATDVGVTADVIRLGVVTSVTGPVPGLFRGAVVGARACAARVNAGGGIFGRRIEIEVGDDQTNENQNRAQTTRLAGRVLAFAGSFSLFDGGMVGPMEQAGVPDLGVTIQENRFRSRLNFSPQPNAPGWQTGGLEFLNRRSPAAGQAIGVLGSALSPVQNEAIKRVVAGFGGKLVYDDTFEATQTDFTANVVRMRGAGVKWLIVTGDTASYARILQAADQQGFEFEIYNPISNAYDANFLKLAGPLAEGTIIYATYVLYGGEDAAVVPEAGEFIRWMRRVDPDAPLDVFALYAWMSCNIVADAARGEAEITRASLLKHLDGLTTYDGNGILAPTNPAKKGPPTCYAVYQVKGGRWTQVETERGKFRCDGKYLFL